MKPGPSEYHAPGTVTESVAALSELGDDVKVQAEGQSLVPVLALRLARPEHLVDINVASKQSGGRRQNGALVVDGLAVNGHAS